MKQAIERSLKSVGVVLTVVVLVGAPARLGEIAEFSLRSRTATRAPAWIRPRAIASPMPLAPPVTMATRPTKGLSIADG